MTQITDETLAQMLTGIYAYERECDRRRGDVSQRVFGHRGASIPEESPTQPGRIAAMRAALEAAEAVHPRPSDPSTKGDRGD